MHENKDRSGEILFSCAEERFFSTESSWEFHSLMRLVSGEMKILSADKTYLFTAGDTLLVPRNQLCLVGKQPRDGKPFQSIVVTLQPQQLKAYYSKNQIKATQPSLQEVRYYSRHPLLENYFHSLLPYSDLKLALPDETTVLKIEEAITTLRLIDKNIDSLLADYTEPGKIDLAEFMEKNFMFNMPLAKFGYLSGRSIATFNRDFRKAFHTSPEKWLVQKRLELAHFHLSKGNVKPVDIYFEAGFKDFSHFSFAFKKRFGYPPSALGFQKKTIQ